MAAVGLLYVGAVLIINGMLLLGRLSPREAAPMNLFVGGIQIAIPTVLIVTAAGDSAQIINGAGIYLFGFTYLWVGIDAIAGLSNRGLGWYSLFVAFAAVVFGLNNIVSVGDISFGVIWLLWAVLWFLFFLVLGIEQATLTSPTGVFSAAVGVITAVVAFLMLLSHWSGSLTEAMVFAVISLIVLAGSFPAGARLARAQSEET